MDTLTTRQVLEQQEQRLTAIEALRDERERRLRRVDDLHQGLRLPCRELEELLATFSPEVQALPGAQRIVELAWELERLWALVEPGLHAIRASGAEIEYLSRTSDVLTREEAANGGGEPGTFTLIDG